MFSAARIQALRKSKGYSQELLAEQSGVSLRTIQRVEQGHTVPRGHTVQALATAIDVSLEALRAPAEPVAAAPMEPAKSLLVSETAPAAPHPPSAMFAPLNSEQRRVLLSAGLEGAATQVLFDSGSSAFALLTSQSSWQELTNPDAPARFTPVNSWGKTLTAHTAPTAARLQIGTIALPLGTVTYIDGTTFAQRTLMRFSGMSGMLGNEVFSQRTLILDVKGGRFGVVVQ